MSEHRKHKVALVSPFSGVNYGTMLQAFSLVHVLREMGCDGEYITYTPYYECSFGERMIRKLNKVIRHLLGEALAYGHNEQEDFSYLNTADFIPLRRVQNEFVKQHISHSAIVYNPRTIRFCTEYDKYIVGSDQSWSLENYDKHAFYFLPWTKSSYKYAYAPSLGTTSISHNHKRILAKHLRSFRYVSCREKTNCATMAALLNKPVEYVLDPTMLLSVTYWRQFAASSADLPKQYILAYILGTKVCISDFAERLSRQTGLPVYYILTCPTYLDKPYVLRDLTPQQWVYALDHAMYVVTDSFHGSLFCINLNTSFYAFTKRPHDVSHVLNDNDRIIELLQTFGLSNRFVKDEDIYQIVISKMEYTGVNSIVADLRLQSLNYLQKIVQDA